MISRPNYEQLLSERIQEPRRFIQVIVGPRQIGKTTLVQQVLSKATIPHSVLSADETLDSDNWIATIWEGERMKMKVAGETERLLVIDEIQKIANWSEQVKKEWDADTWNQVQLKVVLLGSSRLMIMHGLTESLAGRFELIRMTHWTYQEMRDAFGWDLNTYIYYGGYPGAAGFVENEKRWRRYVQDSIIEPSITKDVLETSHIYKPALLRQIFELSCSYSSKMLSLTKMMGQLQDAGNVTTLAAYLQLLRESQLVTGLQKFAIDIARQRGSVPKLQVFNSALFNVYSPHTYKQVLTDPQIWGQEVESAVGAYLLSQADINDLSLYYWRDKDDEVDFILANRYEYIAIEVKSNAEKYNNGLGVFRNKYKPKAAFIVGSGGIPVEQFMLTDIVRLFEL